MQTRRLDHLGLVASEYDELEIAQTINQLVPKEGPRTLIDHGRIVKAMVLNGLGFVSQPLYLVPEFFESKPVELLLGDDVSAEMLNDDTLGRSLDALSDCGVTEAFAAVATRAVKKLGIEAVRGHCDNTSLHVHGDYKVCESEDYHSVKLARGYSRDHRPDLKQVGLALITEHRSRIPILMKPLNGNSNDGPEFGKLVQEHIRNLNPTVELETLIADCALFTKSNLDLLNESGLRFVTRVPRTFKFVEELVERAMDCNEPLDLTDGHQGYEEMLEVNGHKIRALAVRSKEFLDSDRKSVTKSLLKNSNRELKALKGLRAMRFACEEDAQEALDSFRNSNPSLELHGIFVDGEPTYSKRGRPANDECPDDFKFFIRARPAMSLNTYGSNLEKRGWFVLATNHLESPEFSASAILSLYREQWIAESGFRFLKSPEFMTSSLYLKSPKRIEALLMVMTLCLLVYAALEYRIRKTLKEKGQTFPDQKGKPTPKPTARWVFHAFSGIDLLLMESKRIILNLKDRHTALLSVLGPPYEKYYFRET